MSATRKVVDDCDHVLHELVVVISLSRGIDFVGDVVTVPGSESLPDLNAAAMTVHIAKSADVHEDVEAELLTSAKWPEDLIVLAAVPKAEFNDLLPSIRARGLHCLADLTVRIITVFVQKRGRQLHFERFGIEQVNHARPTDR